MTMNFEPALAERFPTLRDYVGHRVMVHAKPAKSIAADMDMSPSLLSRKLHPAEGDTQRFNIDDLEAYLQATGDAAAVIEYLVAKYMDTDDQRRARVLSRVEGMLPELVAMLAAMKGGK
jgi:hypothetical protein